MGRSSRQHLPDGLGSFNPHQGFIKPVVEVREIVGIHTHEMKNGCVQIFDMEAVTNRFRAQLVGFTHRDATFDAASGHPHGEAP